MNHSIYKTLYRAHLGDVNKNSLLESRNEVSDPFYQNLIDLIVEKNTPLVSWDNKPFTTEFLSGSPLQRLDETFFAFVLRIASIIKEESYIRIYQKPESHQAVIAWNAMLRSVIVSGLALLYNVQWTPELLLKYLDPTLVKIFSQGDPLALRKLMINLGIKLAQDEPYPAENVFEKLNFLQISQFSAFYWRYLHWMSEADKLRGDDMTIYKNEWRELLKGPLYRTIRCGICMIHFKNMVKENEKELLDLKGDLPRNMFTMHNKTHSMRRDNYKFLQEPDYTEAQYEADAEFMRQALLP